MSPSASSAQAIQFRASLEPVQYRQDDYRDQQRQYDDSRGYRPEEPRGYRPDDPRGYRPDEPRGYRPDEPRGYRPDESRGYRPDESRGYRQDDRGQRGYDDRRGRSELPGGSYMQSCGEARLQGSALVATCQGPRGNRFESVLDVTRCGRSDITNNNGTLQCGGTRGNARRVD